MKNFVQKGARKVLQHAFILPAVFARELQFEIDKRNRR